MGDVVKRSFFILWSPTGPTPPRRLHQTKHQAQQVAEKMAREHPGQEFFVMRTVSVTKKVDVITETFDDDLPF